MPNNDEKPKTSIDSIRDIEMIFALKKLSKYLTETGWHHEMDNDEFGAEFNLAVAKSKRHKDDILQLSKLDPEIGWGQTRTKEGSVWVTRTTGDFNPWFAGALSLEELLNSTEELSYLLSTITPGNIDDVEFIHYHTFLSSKIVKSYSSVKKDEIKIDINSIHPKILKASKSLFATNHFASAILEAYKVIFNEIKDVSGVKNLDGKKLAEHVFSGDNPIIKLNDLGTESERDEQNGFALLLSGAALGIRNPKAHDLVSQEDKHRTLEYLSLASLLLSRIDERLSVDLFAKESSARQLKTKSEPKPVQAEELPYVYMKPAGLSSNGAGISILQAETYNLSESFVFLEKASILGREINFNDMLVKSGSSVTHSGISDLPYPKDIKPKYIEIYFKSKNNVYYLAQQRLELEKRADGRYNLKGFGKATITKM
jgi:uncharacterized protein (TIGR02391 family)